MRCAVLPVILILASTPVAGQNASVGQTANSSVGQIGQRQSRANAAQNVAPTGRVNNRIVNRIQSRIRSRVDRSYDPQSNAMSPFKVTGAQVRRSAMPNRP